MEPAPPRAVWPRSRKSSGSHSPCPRRCRLRSSNPFPGRMHWWLETQLYLGKPQLGCQASLYCPWTGSFLHRKFQSVFLSMSADYIRSSETLTPKPGTMKIFSDTTQVSPSSKSLSGSKQEFLTHTYFCPVCNPF